jgi:hypothetical protein
MYAILPFLRGQAVFGPEDTEAMSLAFDEVCRALNINGNEREQEVVATRIIELARRGERDPMSIRDRVLREAGAGE